MPLQTDDLYPRRDADAGAEYQAPAAVTFVKVANALLEEMGEDWSEPVRLKFARANDAEVEIVVQTVEQLEPHKIEVHHHHGSNTPPTPPGWIGKANL